MDWATILPVITLLLGYLASFLTQHYLRRRDREWEIENQERQRKWMLDDQRREWERKKLDDLSQLIEKGTASFVDNLSYPYALTEEAYRLSSELLAKIRRSLAQIRDDTLGDMVVDWLDFVEVDKLDKKMPEMTNEEIEEYKSEFSSSAFHVQGRIDTLLEQTYR